MSEAILVSPSENCIFHLLIHENSYPLMAPSQKRTPHSKLEYRKTSLSWNKEYTPNFEDSDWL
jgi:hypothetical protein